MGGSIDSISQAIGQGLTNGDSWKIKKVHSCSSKPRPEGNNGATQNCNQSSYTASYTSKSGGKLIFRGIQAGNKLFQPTAITYSTTINGKEYRLSDRPTIDVWGTPHANSVPVPDGKITPHDSLTIDGATYELQEAHVSNAPGVTEIFELRDPLNNKAKYNGWLFGKNGDKWVFVGSESKEKEGEGLGELINKMEEQYSFILTEAQKDFK